MGACIRKRVLYDMSCKRFHFFVNVEALLQGAGGSHDEKPVSLYYTYVTQ